MKAKGTLKALIGSLCGFLFLSLPPMAAGIYVMLGAIGAVPFDHSGSELGRPGEFAGGVLLIGIGLLTGGLAGSQEEHPGSNWSAIMDRIAEVGCALMMTAFAFLLLLIAAGTGDRSRIAMLSTGFLSIPLPVGDMIVRCLFGLPGLLVAAIAFMQWMGICKGQTVGEQTTAKLDRRTEQSNQPCAPADSDDSTTTTIVINSRDPSGGPFD